MRITRPTCGLPAINPCDYQPGRDRYADTPGGHADRHTLVIEDAERALRTTHQQPAASEESDR